VTNTDLDLDDDLPRPGKVWDSSGPSLAEMLKGQQAVAPATVAVPPAPAEVVAGVSHPDSNLAPVGPKDVAGVWRSLLGGMQERRWGEGWGRGWGGWRGGWCR